MMKYTRRKRNHLLRKRLVINDTLEKMRLKLLLEALPGASPQQPESIASQSNLEIYKIFLSTD